MLVYISFKMSLLRGFYLTKISRSYPHTKGRVWEYLCSLISYLKALMRIVRDNSSSQWLVAAINLKCVTSNRTAIL